MSPVKEIRKLGSVNRTLGWPVQIAIFICSGFAAFLLRFDFRVPPELYKHLMFGLAVWVAAKCLAFRIAKLEQGWWKYVSVTDIARIAAGNLGGSALSFAVIIALGPPGFPRSIYLIDLVLCFLATAGVRVGVRMLVETTAVMSRCSTARAKTLIYGAGEAGIGLLREIRKNRSLPYTAVGFLDDDPQKIGARVRECRVYSVDDLEVLVKKLGIEIILIAIPSATGVQMTRIMSRCHQAGIRCKTVPGLAEMIEGKATAGKIREVAVEDLLGRSPVQLDDRQIREKLEGRVVMVTGAGGSIGSEMCRQIARFAPAAIVGFEIAETALFHIDREMRERFPGVPFYSEIGNIQNMRRLDEVMRQHLPSVVFHAAAYKHVPMMELHIFEAVENNVFGTYNTAVAAMRYNVEDFVLISSDKAVRPTNVMGATKRLAELILLSPRQQRTKFVAVRFGNVLGSNGSVIPIFKQQIAAGGPVTVTHPEMRRYFMTIPEACQLVLEASILGESGQICVLDMGEPVKIVDLARNLILLSGLRPDEDIKIEYTGMRPGEKLYEELSSLVEDTVPTRNEKIRIYVGNGNLEEEPEDKLSELRDACDTRDVGRLGILLKELVSDYGLSAHLLRKMMETTHRERVAAD